MIVILLSDTFTKTYTDHHVFEFSTYLLNCLLLSLYIVKFVFDFYLLLRMRLPTFH